jgi:hypothetical protein
MAVHEKRCACGALSARAEGDPARTSPLSLPGLQAAHRQMSGSGPQSRRAHDVPDPHFGPPTIEVHDERRCPWLPDFGLPREY